MAPQVVDTARVERRHHEHGVEDPLPIELGREDEQLLALDEIDLVEDEDGPPPRLLQPVDDAPRVVVDAAGGVDQ
jgi:hypothetical protein